MSNANNDGEVAVDSAADDGGKPTKTIEPTDVQVQSAEDIKAEAAERGNGVFNMTPAQLQAYTAEVNEIKDRVVQAGKSYAVARWYIGRTAQKLMDDTAKNGGSTYGQATVDGLAVDIGLGRSTVYKCIRLQERFTLKELQKVPIPIDALDFLLSASQTVQKKVYDMLAENVDKESDYRPSVSDVKSMVAEETEKHAEAAGGGGTTDKGKSKTRANPFGTNSATGGSHKQVLGRFIKQCEHIAGAGANLVVSLKEIPNDTDVTDKAELALLQMQEDALAEVDATVKTLQVIAKEFRKAKSARTSKEKEVAKAEKEAEKAKAREAAEKQKAKEKERAEKAAKKAAKKSVKKSAAKKKTAKRSSGKSKLLGSGTSAGKT